jgi:hypothetical protein
MDAVKRALLRFDSPLKSKSRRRVADSPTNRKVAGRTCRIILNAPPRITFRCTYNFLLRDNLGGDS